jgi:hypothetical protein
MRYFNYYRIKSKSNYVWSVRFFSHTFRLRVEHVEDTWRYDFKHLKLYKLDLIPFYYEVGFLQYPIEHSKKLETTNGDYNGHI